ncbi:MAG: DNA primase [Tannerellaceae bacterium]|jgi:DNA primase|nr:DNA primase [Tannerellaceae bacterium]
MIDRGTIEKIRDAANIVEVVSDFVTLRRRGVNFVGLCPFHQDRSPSFYVSPAKNICKCFVCGAGGSPVNFIMQHEQVDFFDSMRYLAKKYNIEIKEKELTDEEKAIRGDRDSMLIVNGWAQGYFSRQLWEDDEGLNIGLRYFRERGFRDDIIRKFQLGYGPDRRDALYSEAIKSGYRKVFLEKTGLIVAYENGNVSDRFRGRVIFPVHTISGKVVAFGGRILKRDEKTAKYLNSPESEVYHKGNELYGIFFARQQIVKSDRCFLVEGYTDVISMHQAGIENVVASSGTALTTAQIRVIHRFTENITVLYDGDAPGIKAALRGIDLLLEEGMNVKVVLLPEGEDPDSFAGKHNATQFAAFIKDNETDFIRFKTKLLITDAAGDPVKRAAVIKDIIRSIAIIPDNIARTLYIKECSAMMDIDEKVLINEINTIRLASTRGSQAVTPKEKEPSPTLSTKEAAPLPAAPQAVPVRSPFEGEELAILRYVVRYGEKVVATYIDESTGREMPLRLAQYILAELEEDGMPLLDPLHKYILEEAADRCCEEGFRAAGHFLYHPDTDVSRLAADLISEKYQLSKYHSKYREIKDEEEMLAVLAPKDLLCFKEACIRKQIEEIGGKIKELQGSGEDEKVISLMREQEALNVIKKSLNKVIGERIVLRM